MRFKIGDTVRIGKGIEIEDCSITELYPKNTNGTVIEVDESEEIHPYIVRFDGVEYGSYRGSNLGEEEIKLVGRPNGHTS